MPPVNLFLTYPPPPPLPRYHFLGGGSKFGCLIAATVRRFGPWSYSTFFFCMDPLPKDRFSPAFRDWPPLWGPTGEDSVFWPLWVG